MKKLLFMLIPFLLFFGLPIGAAEKEEYGLQDETIYYITIDRFNNSDFTNNYDVVLEDPLKYHGGDFQGIIDRLGYIKEMGFTMIALSPIYDNEEDGYHGMWIKDYYQTEEHFGTIDKFKELVSTAHEKEMKVILDFLFVEDVDAIEVAKWWLEETNIDGYRLIQTEETSAEVVSEFAEAVRGLNDELVVITDAKGKEPLDLNVDAVFDYPLNEELRNVFAKPDHSLETVAASLKDYSHIKFMDNPFTHRFTRDTIELNEHPGPRWRLALTFLYTTPGTPFVFYGSEIALDGGEAPDNMRQMDFRTDPELIEYVTSIGDIRQKLPALRRGSFELLFEENGMVVYKREYEGETVVIALNNTTKTQTAQITSGIEADMELRGLLTGDLVRSEGEEYQIILDRDEAEVYLLAEKTGLNILAISVSAGVILLFIGFLIVVKRKSS